jgi:hypothetical protein
MPNFARLAFLTALTLVILGLTSCSSAQIEQAGCDQKDWYELGRRDGGQGTPAGKWENLKKQCSGDFRADWENMYVNGRNAGLVEYCEDSNGYELGRAGTPYFYVCPSTMEPQFLSGYRRGQRARDLELEIRKLDAKIDSIAQRLVVTESGYDRTMLSSEMENLKRLRSQNDRQLDKISKRDSI